MDAVDVATACDEHLAVGQQRGRVTTRLTSPRRAKAAGRTPGSARRIVEFRARKNERRAVALSCHDEHFAVKKQRCRVKSPRGSEAAARIPSSAGWIVQFRA